MCSFNFPPCFRPPPPMFLFSFLQSTNMHKDGYMGTVMISIAQNSGYTNLPKWDDCVSHEEFYTRFFLKLRAIWHNSRIILSIFVHLNISRNLCLKFQSYIYARTRVSALNRRGVRCCGSLRLPSQLFNQVLVICYKQIRFHISADCWVLIT
jgi:hypothetical protein